MKAAEASGKSVEERRQERRQKAVVGTLPDSFLRIPPVDAEPMTAEERDREMAVALQRQLALEQQQQENAAGGVPAGFGGPMLQQPNVLGRLTITVVEAKLTKNYGVTRMDPYARLRVGHNVYETPTCQNGAREPKWNKTINCFLMAGAKSLDVEIYDECTFSPDSLIAHTSIPLTERILSSTEMVDDWWPLSGQEGEQKEGLIHLILSHQALPPGTILPQAPQQQQVVGGRPVVVTPQPLPHQQQVEPEVVELTDAELEEFSKMFPAIDKAVIQAVHTEGGGDREATLNNLLQMGS